MGSDWIWELRVPAEALGVVYALAAERDLRPQRPDGRINLFSNPDADLRTVDDPAEALAAMATGKEHGQFWTNGDVDVFVNGEDGRLVWALDSGHCRRRPGPEADGFRELHGRLTGLWLDAAQRLNATEGRILDEWSTEQIWSLGVHDNRHPTAAGWPAELGWWAYLGPGAADPPPLPEVAARTRRLPNGALLVTLLDDPAAVDVLHYQDLHTRWLGAA